LQQWGWDLGPHECLEVLYHWAMLPVLTTSLDYIKSCVQWMNNSIYVYVNTLFDVPTVTKSCDDAFLRIYLCY
jgi:hypothetical protein